MVRTATLETLPPELHIRVFINLGDTKTLYALIRASPRLLHVFSINKEHVLSHFAKECFNPSVLLEALAVASLAELPHPIPRATAMAFLNTPIEKRNQSLLSSKSVEQWVTLIKLHRLINFFINDYISFALPIHGELQVESYASDGRVSFRTPDATISPSEYARLQRAFCRFELYYHLFSRRLPEHNTCLVYQTPGDDKDSQPGAVTAHEQGQLFLLRYNPADIAEISCVDYYLNFRLSVVLHEVEEFAVEHPRPSYFKQKRAHMDGQDDCPFLFSYDGALRREEEIGYLVSLGLGCIRKIVRAKDMDEKTDLMLHSATDNLGGHAAFISKALNEIHDYYAPLSALKVNSKPTRGDWSKEIDIIEDVSIWCLPWLRPGWKWCCNNEETIYGSGGRFDPRTCVYGFVFWDYGRLQNAANLDWSPRAAFRDHWNTNWDEEDSVQERLIGPEIFSATSNSETPDSDTTDSES
ncbi:hypothetical protein ACLMJK_008296 [Lecanora helva]